MYVYVILISYILGRGLNFTAPQSVRVKIFSKNHQNEWQCFKYMSGKSEKCVTLSEWVANLPFWPKMSKNTWADGVYKHV